MTAVTTPSVTVGTAAPAMTALTTPSVTVGTAAPAMTALTTPSVTVGTAAPAMTALTTPSVTVGTAAPAMTALTTPSVTVGTAAPAMTALTTPSVTVGTAAPAMTALTTPSVTVGTAAPAMAALTTPSVTVGTAAPAMTALTTPSVTAGTAAPAMTVLTTPSVTVGTAAPVMTAVITPSAGAYPVVGLLNDRDYIRWLKATQALNWTVDVLRNFCDTEMQTFHQMLVGRCGGILSSGPCSSSDARCVRGRWTINCPRSVCSKWLSEIAAWRTQNSTKLTMSNADIRQWPLQYWQVSKVYMGAGQDQSNLNPLDTDASGVLQLLNNCKHFANIVDTTKVDAVSINFYS